MSPGGSVVERVANSLGEPSDGLLRVVREAGREAAARALMFAKSDGAERHTPREEMKTIDINAQFAM